MSRIRASENFVSIRKTRPHCVAGIVAGIIDARSIKSRLFKMPSLRCSNVDIGPRTFGLEFLISLASDWNESARPTSSKIASLPLLSTYWNSKRCIPLDAPF